MNDEKKPASAQESLDRLRALFRTMGSALVCYSGGVDSALVLAVAHEVLGPQAIGMTAVSPSLAPFEKEAAVVVARQIGARHGWSIRTRSNARGTWPTRPTAASCKSELYDIAEQKQREWGLEHIVNGTNLDDLGDHRPGLDAAKNARVRSVLVEAGMHKDDVRDVAGLVGLTVWDKPASACLSSRIPYGTAVTRERLAQIGGLEAELRALGLRQVRVRWHAAGASGAMARIEVARDELLHAFDAKDAIVQAGKRFGFAFVTLDLQGYRMGSHNEVIVGKSLRVL